jgi:hypothetical protein
MRPMGRSRSLLGSIHTCWNLTPNSVADSFSIFTLDLLCLSLVLDMHTHRSELTVIHTIVVSSPSTQGSQIYFFQSHCLLQSLCLYYLNTVHIHHNFIHPPSKLLKTFSATRSLRKLETPIISRLSRKKNNHIPSFPPLIHRELEMNSCENP